MEIYENKYYISQICGSKAELLVLDLINYLFSYSIVLFLELFFYL